VLWIRTGFKYSDPDPAFFLNAYPDPDPGSETDEEPDPDPGQTLMSQKVEFLHENICTLCNRSQNIPM